VQAENVYAAVLRLPITIIDGIKDEVFREAARIKTQYKMSLADSIALGEASIMGASLLTSDHHEFDAVEKSESISFLWIR
jgi:predicted nucleic acid-binding protein